MIPRFPGSAFLWGRKRCCVHSFHAHMASDLPEGTALPLDMLLAIAGALPPNVLKCGLAATCRALWNRAPTVVRSFVLDEPVLPPWPLERMTGLRFLTIEACVAHLDPFDKTGPWGLRALTPRTHPHLTELLLLHDGCELCMPDMEYDGLTEHFIDWLCVDQGGSRITTLAISRGVSWVALATAIRDGQLPALHTLELLAPTGIDTAFTTLINTGALASLRRLTLRGAMANVPDDTTADLSTLTALEELELHDTSEQFGQGELELEGLPRNLRSLTLRGPTFRFYRPMRIPTWCPYIERLSYERGQLYEFPVEQLPRLRFLEVRGFGCAFGGIPECPVLETLRLVAGGGFAFPFTIELPRLSTLRSLRIEGAGDKVVGLDATNLPNLCHLSLRRVCILDKTSFPWCSTTINCDEWARRRLHGFPHLETLSMEDMVEPTPPSPAQPGL